MFMLIDVTHLCIHYERKIQEYSIVLRNGKVMTKSTLWYSDRHWLQQNAFFREHLIGEVWELHLLPIETKHLSCITTIVQWK
jgi:hypothetical protein